MPSAPEIVTRAAQPYVAIRTRMTMTELPGLGPLLGQVFAWLGRPPPDPRTQLAFRLAD